MNRETKRMLKRQGVLDEKGTPKRSGPRETPRKRVGPAQYLREVRDEMRKVAWPTQPEVIRYSIVVGVTVVVVAVFVGGLDYGMRAIAGWFYK